MNDKYSADTVSLDLSDTYYNMKPKVPLNIVEARAAGDGVRCITPYCAPIEAVRTARGSATWACPAEPLHRRT